MISESLVLYLRKEGTDPLDFNMLLQKTFFFFMFFKYEFEKSIGKKK